MEISRSSFIYKVAYGQETKKTTVSNLCPFFWRLVFMAFLAWPMIGILHGILMIIVSICAILGFLFARRPGDQGLFVPYERWPKVFGLRIWPILFLVPSLGPRVWFWLSPGTQVAFLTALLILVGCMIFSVILVAVDDLIQWSRRTVEERKDTAIGITLLYLKAKKDKVCPIIYFK